MGKPTVSYYDVRGRGQFIFALLNYLKIDFNHVILPLTFPPEIVEKCTFGQVPHYKDEDIEMCETHAITRFIASKYNFCGKNLIEKAKVDEIIESFWDVLNPVFIATFVYDDKGREQFKKQNRVKYLLDCYEKILSKNKHAAGTDDYTFADLGMYITYDYVDLLGYVNDKSIYPKLEELRNFFKSLPQMENYTESIKKYTR